MSIPYKMSSVGDSLSTRIGDYLTFTPDGSISGGCLINVTNVDNVCRDKPYQTTWTITLPSAESAVYAFSNSGLESFAADLSNVFNGKGAFYQCLNLSAFNSTLNSLSDGTAMFGGCPLDKESSLRILNSLPTYSSGTHTLLLGMDISNEGDEDIQSALNSAADKGWNVTAEWNNPGYPSGYIPAYFLNKTDKNGSGMNTQIKPTVNTGIWGDIISSSRWVESYSTSSLRWSAPAYGTNTGFFYFSGTWRVIGITANTPYISTLNWKNARNANGQVIASCQRLNDGTTKEVALTPIDATSTANANLFYYDNSIIRQVKFSEYDKITHDLIPAIDKEGNACMFNKITNTPFYKASSTALDYIIGLTIEQARLLYKLPTVTNKTLYISLPSSVFDVDGNIADSDINNAISSAQSNGWNFEIQYYEDFTEDYLSAYFLESAGEQYINIDYSLHPDSFAEIDTQQTLLPSNSFKGGLLGGDTTNNYFAIWNSVWREGYPRFDYNGNTLSNKFSIYVGDRAIFKKVAHQNFINGVNFGDNTIPTETPTWEVKNVALFSTSLSTSYAFYGRIFSAKIGRADTIGRDFIPAIDKNGKPCMFDKVSKTSFVNANTTEGAVDFVVGMTVHQAKTLNKLPQTTGDTLKISLPSSVFDEDGNITNADINTALDAAKAKNWNFEIQNY